MCFTIVGNKTEFYIILEYFIVLTAGLVLRLHGKRLAEGHNIFKSAKTVANSVSFQKSGSKINI